MIDYFIYSHTDYLDILKIQTDYLPKIGKFTLFIDKNDYDLTEIYSKYDRVVYYHSSDPYAKRIMTCLEQIEEDYFILVRDIDILLSVDNFKLEQLLTFTKQNSLDCVNLHQTMDPLSEKKLLKIKDFNDFSTWKVKLETEEIDDSVYLVVQDNPGHYIFNVNPSIWKRDALYEIVQAFPHKTYRNIEDPDVQHFCTKYRVVRIYSKNDIDCGYYNCLDFFKFLHITHGGKILPLNSTATSTHGQSYKPVRDEFVHIVNKYNLRQSNKWVNYDC